MTQFGTKDSLRLALAEEEYQQVETVYFDPTSEDCAVEPAEDKNSVTLIFTRTNGSSRKVTFSARRGFRYGGYGFYINESNQHFVSVYFNPV